MSKITEEELLSSIQEKFIGACRYLFHCSMSGSEDEEAKAVKMLETEKAEAAKKLQAYTAQQVLEARISELEALLHPDLFSYESRAKQALLDRIAQLKQGQSDEQRQRNQEEVL